MSFSDLTKTDLINLPMLLDGSLKAFDAFAIVTLDQSTYDQGFFDFFVILQESVTRSMFRLPITDSMKIKVDLFKKVSKDQKSYVDVPVLNGAVCFHGMKTFRIKVDCGQAGSTSIKFC